jgi:hypothetical protein
MPIFAERTETGPQAENPNESLPNRAITHRRFATQVVVEATALRKDG